MQMTIDLFNQCDAERTFGATHNIDTEQRVPLPQAPVGESTGCP
jgi:hypothetical protein